MDYKMDVCGGCETCEIACSYKHTGEFNHLISSIEIIELEDKPGYKVRINEDTGTGRIPCNGCADIDGDPMCVQFCPKAKELKKIIEQFKAVQCRQTSEGQ